MPRYIILTRLASNAFDDPKEFPALAEKVSARIKEQCPNVTWQDSYATMGRYDVVDIVEAPSTEEVEKAAMIIRAGGHAVTETMPATPWETFLESLKS